MNKSEYKVIILYPQYCIFKFIYPYIVSGPKEKKSTVNSPLSTLWLLKGSFMYVCTFLSLTIEGYRRIQNHFDWI